MLLNAILWAILQQFQGENKLHFDERMLSATSGAGTAYPSEPPEFTPVFSGIRVTWSLVLYVCFVDNCLSVCTFSFGYCVVCFSSIFGFWLPLWYLQTLLKQSRHFSYSLMPRDIREATHFTTVIVLLGLWKPTICRTGGEHTNIQPPMRS